MLYHITKATFSHYQNNKNAINTFSTGKNDYNNGKFKGDIPLFLFFNNLYY